MTNEINEKKCTKCGEVKPLSCFCKNRRMPDGLCCHCKVCQKNYRENLGKSKEKPEKVCSKCGILKPLSDFAKSNQSRDGCSGHCKKCKCEYARFGNKVRKENSGGGDLNSWKQVDSALREMAELQHFINAENAACEKRLDLIREYRDETIESAVGHQAALQFLLTAFIEKTVTKGTINRDFRFGSMRFSHGKLSFKLNVELAQKLIDKPLPPRLAWH